MAYSEAEKQAAVTRPDFENNLAEFETTFLKFASETDPNFDLNLLKHNPLAPISVLNFSPPAELMHPTTKYELKLPIRLATPQTVNSDIVGEKVILEGNIRVQGSIFGTTEVFIGPNCIIESNVISGGKVRIEEGSTVGGTVTGETVELSGPLTISGPVVSRTDLTVTGHLTAEALLAGESIFLMGAAGDEVRLAASYILAYRGDIEVAVPVFLGTGKAVSSDTQKFYFSHNNGSFRLVRARQANSTGNRLTEQNTILTALTDAELEKLLAELAVLEQHQ